MKNVTLEAILMIRNQKYQKKMRSLQEDGSRAWRAASRMMFSEVDLEAFMLGVT